MGELLIHILKHGKALCGKPGVPGDWEDGHRWLRFDRPDHFEEQSPFMCQSCISVFTQDILAQE